MLPSNSEPSTARAHWPRVDPATTCNRIRHCLKTRDCGPRWWKPAAACGADASTTPAKLWQHWRNATNQLRDRRERYMVANRSGHQINRRMFLSGIAMAGTAAGSALAGGVPAAAVRCPPDRPDGITPLKIDAVEVLVLRGHYTAESGVDHQPQVNPLDVYDELRPAPYSDKPGGIKEVQYEAHYLRIRTAAGLEGLYGPIEREPATIVLEDLRQFLIGKDALAGEVLW